MSGVCVCVNKFMVSLYEWLCSAERSFYIPDDDGDEGGPLDLIVNGLAGCDGPVINCVTYDYITVCNPVYYICLCLRLWRRHARVKREEKRMSAALRCP